MLWALHVRIYESEVGPSYPVVEHVFYGKTKDEAQGYCRAHLGTDTFFRGCVEDNKFDGIDCWHDSYWERVR